MKKILMLLPVIGLLLVGSSGKSISASGYKSVRTVVKADAYNSAGIHIPCVIGSSQEQPLTYECQVDTGDAVTLPYVLVGPLTFRFIGGKPGHPLVGVSGINGNAENLPTEWANLTVAGKKFHVLLVQSQTQTEPLLGMSILKRVSQTFSVDWKTGKIGFYGTAGKVSKVWKAQNN